MVLGTFKGVVRVDCVDPGAVETVPVGCIYLDRNWQDSQVYHLVAEKQQLGSHKPGPPAPKVPTYEKLAHSRH